MKICVETDSSGRIISTFNTTDGENCICVPNDFPFDKQHDYKIVDGAIVYDPTPETNSITPTPEERIAALEAALAALMAQKGDT